MEVKAADTACVKTAKVLLSVNCGSPLGCSQPAFYQTCVKFATCLTYN